MRIPVDFSHFILLRDLDTGAETCFLVPRGQKTPVHVPKLTINNLKELLEPASVVGDELSTAEEPLPLEAAAQIERRAQPVAPPQAARVLVPGSLGEAPSDMFGSVPEG